MNVFIEIAAALIDIEAELRQLNLWEAQIPSAEALASTEPFCVDTLSFTQWLQFIFIPRMYALVKNQQLPPGRCDIKPLAEECFRNSRLDVVRLQNSLGHLDQLINRE
jgi:uncharacterized protein YqcC (DUF446 family)